MKNASVLRKGGAIRRVHRLCTASAVQPLIHHSLTVLLTFKIYSMHDQIHLPYSQAHELSQPRVVGRREIVAPAAQHAAEAVGCERHAGNVRLVTRAADLVHDS